MHRRVGLALVSVVLALAGSVQLLHTFSLRAYRGIEPVCRVMTPERVVALSFDDGPDPSYTPTVLRLLSTEGDHATFFVTGEHASEYPQLIASIVASGNEVGDHTWSHPHLSSLDESQAMSEFDRTAASLASVAPVRLVRPPYGEVAATTLSGLRAEGFIPVDWSLPLDHYIDGLHLSAHDAAAAIARDVSPGDIVLAHDARDGGIDRTQAVATLGLLLPLLHSRGYSVVSVSALLEDGAPVLGTPRPWFWQSGFACPAR